MLFKSQVYTQVSGSIGGITYSRNKGGLYTRSRATPTNPNTSLQNTVRLLLSDLSTRWSSTLTALQRLSWDLYAFSVTRPNKLGEQINLSGVNMYIRCNLPRLQAAMTRIDTAPGIFNVGGFTSPTATVSMATDLLTVAFTNTDAWATAVGGAMLAFISVPKNPSINYFKGPYRFAGKIPGAVVPPTSPQTIALPIPGVAGQKVFFKISVTQVDGRLSNDFLGNAQG